MTRTLLPLRGSRTWLRLAACRNVEDPEIFFPRLWNNQPENNKKFQKALEYCNRCPVTEECKASMTKDDWGVWGGEWFPPNGARPEDPTPNSSRVA